MIILLNWRYHKSAAQNYILAAIVQVHQVLLHKDPRRTVVHRLHPTRTIHIPAQGALVKVEFPLLPAVVHEAMTAHRVLL